MIVIVVLPSQTSRAKGLLCRGFKFPYDLWKLQALAESKQDMNMIRHHGSGKQVDGSFHVQVLQRAEYGGRQVFRFQAGLPVLCATGDEVSLAWDAEAALAEAF